MSIVRMSFASPRAVLSSFLFGAVALGAVACAAPEGDAPVAVDAAEPVAAAPEATTLGRGEGEDVAVRQLRRHCNVAATATRNGEPVAAEQAAPECFDSFSDAIFAATKGAVRLAEDATPESLKQLPADKTAMLATYLLGIVYVAPRWDAFWGTRNITHVGTCDQGYEYSIGNLSTIGWNDKISSVVTYLGCAHAFYYDNAGFGGARLDCPPAPPGGHDTCYYNLGALDDRASSVRWTNSPL
jgi:hypothetical protein